MKRIALLVVLVLGFAVNAVAEFKDDDVSAEWKNMTEREKTFYLSGITNAFTVMCAKESTSAEEYVACRKKFSLRQDLPASLFILFGKAYTAGRYPDIPSDALVHIWGLVPENEQEEKLEYMQRFSKERRPAYGGKHQ